MIKLNQIGTLVDLPKCTCTLNSDKLYLHYPDCPYRKQVESDIKKNVKEGENGG